MNCVERVTVGGGESQHAGLRTSVVGLGDGVEFFLAGGIPQHQPYILAIHAENTQNMDSFERKKNMEETDDSFCFFAFQNNETTMTNDH